MSGDVWLIGAGTMAEDYWKVFNALSQSVTVIGRGTELAKRFKKNTSKDVYVGGLASFLETNPEVPSHVVVAVGIESLFKTTKQLLEYGVVNILVEKPGALLTHEFLELSELATSNRANVFIAYNRRFYSAVKHAKSLIEKEGGVTSFNFEFTEWAHRIGELKKAEGVLEKWLLGNSTHVIDLAFYLGGYPKEIKSYTSGGVDWHQSASIFCGAGVSQKGALFSYRADWESAGRWSVEVLTRESKYIFCPMEKLQIQKRGTISQEFVEINYELDERFKPGLFDQTKSFLTNEVAEFCTILEQTKHVSLYNKMANYKG